MMKRFIININFFFEHKHHTDTSLYLLSLALALSVHNKLKKSIAPGLRACPSRSCDGWVCGLGAVGASLVFGLVRGTGSFAVVLPSVVLVSRIQLVQRYRGNIALVWDSEWRKGWMGHHHLEDVRRPNSLWMIHQHRWCASVCISENVSHCKPGVVCDLRFE